MIYTITLNPAIDVSLHIRGGLKPGVINKSFGMKTDPGGKGINVSKILKVMGKESEVCVGVCGEDGERLISMLQEDFEVFCIRYPSGNTRTNIKLSSENGITTDINGDGPSYDRDSVEGLRSLIMEKLSCGDIVVLSGSPPSGSPSGLYADLIRSFKSVDGVKVILDCAGSYLAEGVEAGPYAVKPTCEELGITCDRISAMEAAAKVISGGIEYCLISMGENGAVFASSSCEPIYSEAIDVNVVCSTGCGDAMTAGLAYALDNKMSSKDAFRLCMALASAEAETEGTGVPSKERIMELYDNIPL